MESIIQIPLQCMNCQFSTTTMFTLMKHMETNHPGSLETIQWLISSSIALHGQRQVIAFLTPYLIALEMLTQQFTTSSNQSHSPFTTNLGEDSGLDDDDSNSDDTSFCTCGNTC